MVATYTNLDRFQLKIYSVKGNEAVILKYIQNAWQNGDFDARIEGGESANEMALRARNCINYLKEIKRNQILVCSHGRTIRALVCLMHYESLEKMEEYHHANLGLYKFELEHNKWNCILKNDTKHLMKSLQMN